MRKKYRLTALALCASLLCGCAPAADSNQFPTISFFSQENSASSSLGCQSAANSAKTSPTSLNSVPALPEESEQPDETFLASLDAFCAKAGSAVLKEKAGENTLFSPVSLYLALALSAKGAEGTTKAQLKTALGAQEFSDDFLCENAARLTSALNVQGEFGRSALAASLWLQEGLSFKEPFLTAAAKHFYAQAYALDFEKPAAKEAIAAWLEKHCGSIAPPELTAQQVMALYTTISFEDEWTTAFSQSATAPAAFTRIDGQTVTCDFLNRTAFSGFTITDLYTAARLSCKDAGSVTFYLPHEGKTPADLVGDPAVLAELLSADSEEKMRGYGEVVWSIPKFDFACDLSLNEALSALGIEDAFDPARADFSAITEESSLYLSSARQAARISVDEKGVSAAAYTELAYVGGGMPEDHAEMILDRPFVFSITARNGAVLFVGAVYDPTLQ